MGVESPSVVEHFNVVSDIPTSILSNSVMRKKGPFRFNLPKNLSAKGRVVQWDLTTALSLIHT